MVTPVLLRNHAITGVYWVDNLSSSAALSNMMTKGLDVEEEISIERDTDEPVQQNVSVIGLLLKNNLVDLIGFAADNFMRNEASALLIFPVRLGNQTPFLDYLDLDQSILGGNIFSTEFSQSFSVPGSISPLSL